MLKIDAESIRQDFFLHALEETTYKVNLKIFEEAFDQVGIYMQRKFLLPFFREVDGAKLSVGTITKTFFHFDHYYS